MSADLPHPREVFDFEGGDVAERAFADAMERGRLHHAWLVAGPEGVGKATFAYRVARRLLGAREFPKNGILGAGADDPVSRLIAGRAHPDLLVLQRDPEDGKARKQIPVEEARGLPEFFAKTPAMAPWRVAIVDTADDLNLSGANALLKTLEEPPSRGILLLVTDRPAALLPTIRSRCRLLRFEAPAVERTAAWLGARAGVAEAEAMRLAAMAKGAPGRAWRLATSNALAADDAAKDLLASLPAPDPAAMLALADGFRGGEGAERFALLFDRLSARIRDLAAARALSGESGLDPWAETFEFVSALPRQVEAVNLDRADAFNAALARMKFAATAC
ncbi:MAG TPA: DNA polymerase III subunit delta' [Caulobacteraceae bacterium]